MVRVYIAVNLCSPSDECFGIASQDFLILSGARQVLSPSSRSSRPAEAQVSSRHSYCAARSHVTRQMWRTSLRNLLSSDTDLQMRDSCLSWSVFCLRSVLSRGPSAPPPGCVSAERGQSRTYLHVQLHFTLCSHECCPVSQYLAENEPLGATSEDKVRDAAAGLEMNAVTVTWAAGVRGRALNLNLSYSYLLSLLMVNAAPVLKTPLHFQLTNSSGRRHLEEFTVTLVSSFSIACWHVH